MKCQLIYQIFQTEIKTASLIVSGEHTRRRSPNTKTPQKHESREDDLLCRWRERLKNLQEVGIYILSYQCHANDWRKNYMPVFDRWERVGKKKTKWRASETTPQHIQLSKNCTLQRYEKLTSESEGIGRCCMVAGGLPDLGMTYVKQNELKTQRTQSWKVHQWSIKYFFGFFGHKKSDSTAVLILSNAYVQNSFLPFKFIIQNCIPLMIDFLNTH